MCMKTEEALGFGFNCPGLHGIVTQSQEHEDSEKVRHKNAPRGEVIYYPRRCNWSP